MDFGYLTGMWWALAAIPIVVFYILKVRLRRVPISTTMFWEQVFEEKRPRAIWQQLRHLLSLLLQLAMLLLLIAALVDPIFPWEMLKARRVVLVIDNSASMNATDVSPSRLSSALEEARRSVNTLRWRDEMAVISARTSPQVLCGLTGHRRTLLRAIDTVEPTDSPTRLRESIALARRLLAGHANGQIVVLSDGGGRSSYEEPVADVEAGSPPALTEEDKPDGQTSEIRWVVNGQGADSAPDNIGITQFQTRRSLIDPIGFDVQVEVVNYGEEPAECRLELELNEQIVDVLPLEPEPGVPWRKTFSHATAEGGTLVASIDRRDMLPSDNRAVALLPRREKIPVTLVSAGNLYLQRVLEVLPLVELTITDKVPAAAPPGGILVLHNQEAETLPAGNVMIIGPRSASPYWQLGETLQDPLVAQQDTDSPLMAHVSLTNVLMPEAKQLKLEGDEVEILATSLADDPLYVAVERPEGKLLALTVVLEKGDLPLRTAFPILLTNAVGWFQGSEGELQEALATGDTIEVDLAEIEGNRKRSLPVEGAGIRNVSAGGGLASEWFLLAPDGKRLALPGGVDTTTLGPFEQSGVWKIIPADAQNPDTPAAEIEPTWQVACNLAHAAESDLRTGAESDAASGAGGSWWSGHPLWFYLVAMLLVVIVLEWSLYQRRWIS